MHLHERMDKIFVASAWQHRTLRTVFDPFSAEWGQTSIDEKINILKRIINSGENLDRIIFEYEAFYKEMNRQDISIDCKAGLVQILDHLLK